MAAKKQKTKAKKRNKGGQPGKFTPEAVQTVFDLAKKGLNDKDIAEVIGIHPGHFCAWKGSYPEFAEALKEAREKPVALVEAALFRSAVGYTHMAEIVSFSKHGKERRARVLKHYAPNPTSIGMYLRAHAPHKYRETLTVVPPLPPTEAGKADEPVSFDTFVERAGYPKAFPKQEEMRAFGMLETATRLLLGARGVGKTDYVTMLGVAYDLYLDWFNARIATRDGKPTSPSMTNLIVTKSTDRNAAILDEIAKACEANGMVFEKKNSKCIRVAGLHGKDHSVSTITIGAKSVRGRHPKRIIMDDPVTEDDDSEATRKKVQKLYNELMKLTINVLIIGQPVHKFDLYETLRDIVLKMEVPHGCIPELDHDLEAQRAAGVSEESISASYHLKVISETGMPLEKVQIIPEWPEGDTAVAFIDPSFEGGDYTALSVIKGYFDGIVVFGKVWKRAWNDCVDDIMKVCEDLNVKRVCFETNSLGDMPVTILREVAPEGMGVTGKKSTGNKHSRIMAAGAYAKLIRIAKTSDKLYIDQVKKYEYKSKNDDAPDSLASGMEWIGLIRGKL